MPFAHVHVHVLVASLVDVCVVFTSVFRLLIFGRKDRQSFNILSFFHACFFLPYMLTPSASPLLTNNGWQVCSATAFKGR